MITKIKKKCMRFFAALAQCAQWISFFPRYSEEKPKSAQQTLRDDYMRIANDMRKILGLPPFIDKK